MESQCDHRFHPFFRIALGVTRLEGTVLWIVIRAATVTVALGHRGKPLWFKVWGITRLPFGGFARGHLYTTHQLDRKHLSRVTPSPCVGVIFLGSAHKISPTVHAVRLTARQQFYRLGMFSRSEHAST